MATLRLKAIVTEDRQLQVELPDSILPGEIEILVDVPATQPVRRYTAREIMALPYHEREQIVAASFNAATNEDFEIFESYSEEPLDD